MKQNIYPLSWKFKCAMKLFYHISITTSLTLALSSCRGAFAFIQPSIQKLPIHPSTTVPNDIQAWRDIGNVHKGRLSFHSQNMQGHFTSVTTTNSRMKLSVGDSMSELSNALLPLTSSIPGPAQAIGINAVLFALLRSKLLKVLTEGGFLSAFILGSGLWMSVLGWRAWTLCVLYLFFGSAVTKIKFQEKEDLGIAEARGGRRGPENVWGSALTGLICCGLATFFSPSNPTLTSMFTLAYVASIATKLSDTFASEVGKAYGKTTFLITTFQKVPAGTEGAVSAEGTLAALVGAFILPLYGLSVGLLDGMNTVSIATIAAFLATFAESWIGAQIQGKKGFEWMTNEVVNFFNTVIGASLSIIGMMFLGA